MTLFNADPAPKADPKRTANVPRPLAKIEGLAEDAYDKAVARDFDAVAGAVAKMELLWTGYRSQAQKDGASERLLSALDLALSALSRAKRESVPAARAANAISASMDELYSLYQPVVPPAIMKLDCLGRELSLDGMENSFSLAASHLETTDRTWATLEDALVKAGGDAERASFNQVLSAMQKARDDQDGPALTQAAKTSLEIVDDIEKVFSH